MRSTWEFMSLLFLGVLLCCLGVGLADPKPIRGSLAMFLIGLPLSGCGWAVVNQTRPPDPPTNLMQWWFWRLQTLPPLRRTVVGRLLQILGLALMVLSVVWLVEGPIPWVARFSELIAAVSFYILLALAIVLQLRQFVGRK